jgi:hypothetical protein
MTIEQKPLNKKIQTLTGKTIERKGTYKLAVLQNAADVAEVLGDNLAAFAAFGYRAFVRQSANNAIGGGGKKEKELKSALRNFKSALESAVKYMDMPQDQAVQFLLAKEAFAGVKAYIANLEAASDVVSLDYSVVFPVPEFSAIEEDDDSDAE